MSDFYSKEELMTMPFKILKGLDITTPEQEQLVQEAVTAREQVMPPTQSINRRDVPDIQNQEEEAEWQDIINQRTRKLMGFDTPENRLREEAPQRVSPSDSSFNPLRADLAEEAGEGVPVVLTSNTGAPTMGAPRRGRPAKK